MFEPNREQFCKEYAGLQRLIDAGAYSEQDHEGNYAPDGIEKRIDELNEWAIAQGLVFVPVGSNYHLQAASQEELDAYKEAIQERSVHHVSTKRSYLVRYEVSVGTQEYDVSITVEASDRSEACTETLRMIQEKYGSDAVLLSLDISAEERTDR